MSERNAITEFFFIRHAPVQKAEGHVPPHDPDIITDAFDTEALRAYLPHSADWHITSLRRTAQTAALLAETLSPRSTRVVPELTEQFLGDWHGQLIADVWQELAPQPKHNWTFAPGHLVPPNGENFDTLFARVGDWHGKITQQAFDAPQVIVSHSGTMRAIFGHMFGLDPARALCVRIPHFGCIHASLMASDQAAPHEGGQWQLHHIGAIAIPTAL